MEGQFPVGAGRLVVDTLGFVPGVPTERPLFIKNRKQPYDLFGQPDLDLTDVQKKAYNGLDPRPHRRSPEPPGHLWKPFDEAAVLDAIRLAVGTDPEPANTPAPLVATPER